VDEIDNQLDQECDVVSKCVSSPSIKQGCKAQKKKIDLTTPTQRDNIPCWGC